MEEEVQEVSPPALGASGGVARSGAGWAHVTQKQIDGKSGLQCSFCNKRFAGIIYFEFCYRDVSISLSLSLSRSDGAEPCSREKLSDRRVQKGAPRHEA